MPPKKPSAQAVNIAETLAKAQDRLDAAVGDLRRIQEDLQPVNADTAARAALRPHVNHALDMADRAARVLRDDIQNDKLARTLTATP